MWSITGETGELDSLAVYLHVFHRHLYCTQEVGLALHATDMGPWWAMLVYSRFTRRCRGCEFYNSNKLSIRYLDIIVDHNLKLETNCIC